MQLSGMNVGTATKADAAALLALINLIQPHMPWTQAHLHWQFFDGPAGPATLYVVRERDAIVALYAAVPQVFEVGGCTCEARMIQDVMTHPNFRGRGFLHHLATVCLDDLKRSGHTGYTFPNDQSENSFRRAGWSVLCEVPTRSKQLNDERTAERTTAELTMPERHAIALIPVEEGFGDWATRVWDAAGLSVGIRRDALFLNWRYSKPDNQYQSFRMDDDCGLLVSKLYVNGESRVLHILELLLKSPHRSMLPAVLDYCEQLAVTHGAQTMTAWLPDGHPYASAFDRAGLVINRLRKRIVFVQPGAAARAHEVENHAAWHLTQGDSDVY